MGLLIGSDCPRAIVPREVIPGGCNDPYALRIELGWGLVGKVESYSEDDDDVFGVINRIVTREVAVVGSGDERKFCYFTIETKAKEIINPFQINQMFEMDFSEKSVNNDKLSQEDKTFLQRMEQGIHQGTDGHYEMPLPFREGLPHLPNNKSFAIRRLQKLAQRFKRDKNYRDDYTNFMREVIEKGYAEEVQDGELATNDGKVWCIPHHGVYHPKKPDKIHVVFDCSATFLGESLNKHLLPGPDLTNGLVGVLCRFREEPVAFMCDLEAMFHQFKVDQNHRNFLRFLWWPNGGIKIITN